jgi:DNA-binding response OmpR family regulator
MGEIGVLLIEDNSAISGALGLALSQNYSFEIASSGKAGLEIIQKRKIEIIIIDLDLPDISGLQVCKRIRKIGVQAPILILSNDKRLSTKLELFDAGADDYLVKPFRLGELKARLNAIRTRQQIYKLALLANSKTPSLILNKTNQSVIRDGGQSISLRTKEYAILEYLVKNAGETVSRSLLASYAWEDQGEPWSNSVDVHIKHLRDKIDKPYKERLITTIHGYGYRLETR